MNHRKPITRLALLGLFCTGMLASTQALAYTAYQLHVGYYAIVCSDGAIFSYSGGEDGLDIVGPALCEGHGGIAGGPGDGVTIERAPAELRRDLKGCNGKQGEPVRKIEGARRCTAVAGATKPHPAKPGAMRPEAARRVDKASPKLAE